MTENQKKKAIRFPKRAALLAAALAAALCLTAAAAEVPAVQEFFATVFVTISTNDDMVSGLSIPTVAVEEREGRSILTVNGEETDVTDTLAKEGKYLYEGDGFQVEVDEQGVAVVTAYGDDNTMVTYTVGGETGGGVVYKVASEDENGNPITDTVKAFDADEKLGSYNVVVDPSGAADASADDVKWSNYNVVVDPSGAMNATPAGE